MTLHLLGPALGQRRPGGSTAAGVSIGAAAGAGAARRMDVTRRAGGPLLAGHGNELGAAQPACQPAQGARAAPGPGHRRADPGRAPSWALGATHRPGRGRGLQRCACAGLHAPEFERFDRWLREWRQDWHGRRAFARESMAEELEDDDPPAAAPAGPGFYGRRVELARLRVSAAGADGGGGCRGRKEPARRRGLRQVLWLRCREGLRQMAFGAVAELFSGHAHMAAGAGGLARCRAPAADIAPSHCHRWTLSPPACACSRGWRARWNSRSACWRWMTCSGRTGHARLAGHAGASRTAAVGGHGAQRRTVRGGPRHAAVAAGQRPGRCRHAPRSGARRAQCAAARPPARPGRGGRLCGRTPGFRPCGPTPPATPSAPSN